MHANSPPRMSWRSLHKNSKEEIDVSMNAVKIVGQINQYPNKWDGSHKHGLLWHSSSVPSLCKYVCKCVELCEAGSQHFYMTMGISALAVVFKARLLTIPCDSCGRRRNYVGSGSPGINQATAEELKC